MSARAIRWFVVGVWLMSVLVAGGCTSEPNTGVPKSEDQSELLQPAEQASDAVGTANDLIEQQSDQVEDLGAE